MNLQVFDSQCRNGVISWRARDMWGTHVSSGLWPGISNVLVCTCWDPSLTIWKSWKSDDSSESSQLWILIILSLNSSLKLILIIMIIYTRWFRVISYDKYDHNYGQIIMIIYNFDSFKNRWISSLLVHAHTIMKKLWNIKWGFFQPVQNPGKL